LSRCFTIQDKFDFHLPRTHPRQVEEPLEKMPFDRHSERIEESLLALNPRKEGFLGKKGCLGMSAI
jgi:hypothetical protein